VAKTARAAPLPCQGRHSRPASVARVGGGVGRCRCRSRILHDAPLPPLARSEPDGSIAPQGECEWLVTNGVLPTEMVTRNRKIEAARPWTPVFTHGDLQITMVRRR
jgi:hypothetical protein